MLVNVTATDVAADTFVTVWPSGSPRPTASSLNPATGETGANLVVTPLGAGQTIDLYNHTGSVDLVADLGGWFYH